jgi:hypothetical protein
MYELRGIACNVNVGASIHMMEPPALVRGGSGRFIIIRYTGAIALRKNVFGRHGSHRNGGNGFIEKQRIGRSHQGRSWGISFQLSHVGSNSTSERSRKRSMSRAHIVHRMQNRAHTACHIRSTWMRKPGSK